MISEIKIKINDIFYTFAYTRVITLHKQIKTYLVIKHKKNNDSVPTVSTYMVY